MRAPAPDHDRALPRKRDRSVPAVYALVSLVLVAGALTFALSSPPPSTPPLAEVAPAPQENIEVERVEQSSQFGDGQSGEGDCVPGDPGCEGASAEAPSPAPTPATQPPGQERLSGGNTWPCVPGPGGPRQTEDPQSPPCKLEKFEGDNGGVTSPGVTATTIRVAVPMARPLQYAYEEVGQALVAHVNERYELYGRRIELVPVELPDGDHRDPAVQRAAAADVAAVDVFASLEYPGFGPYQAELANRRIVSFTGGSSEGIVRASDVARFDPYVWSIYASFEDVQRIAGRAVCEGLAGRGARHGGPDVADRTRRFGVVIQTSRSFGVLGVPPDVLLTALEACGADHRTYEQPADAAEVSVQVQRMQTDGVTTVVCACRAFGSATEHYFDGADDLGYQPEWFLAGPRVDYLSQGNRVSPQGYSPRQMAHVFGIDAHLRRLGRDGARGGKNYGEHYWFHAVRAEDPEVVLQRSAVVYYDLYGQLLMLVSGVQWAGPDLTPRTFANALKGLRYANPDVGQPRWYQPSVGFGPADHAFNSDVALYWWRAPDEAAHQARADFGEMCFLGDGARFTADTVPADADGLFFDSEAGCR